MDKLGKQNSVMWRKYGLAQKETKMTRVTAAVVHMFQNQKRIPAAHIIVDVDLLQSLPLPRFLLLLHHHLLLLLVRNHHHVVFIFALLKFCFRLFLFLFFFLLGRHRFRRRRRPTPPVQRDARSTRSGAASFRQWPVSWNTIARRSTPPPRPGKPSKTQYNLAKKKPVYPVKLSATR